MIDIYDINLLTETTMPPIIRCSQGDNGIRQIRFNLYNGSDVFVPSGLSAMVYGLRPDGASWGPDYCTISGSTVIFTLTEKMTMIGGRSTGELAFMDQYGNKVSTTNFTLMVETMPLPGVYDESKCDFSGKMSELLTQAMSKLEAETATRKKSDEELRQKLLAGGFYTDQDMTNKYNEGYNRGVADADGRALPGSNNYQAGYNAGYNTGYNNGKAVSDVFTFAYYGTYESQGGSFSKQYYKLTRTDLDTGFIIDRKPQYGGGHVTVKCTPSSDKTSYTFELSSYKTGQGGWLPRSSVTWTIQQISAGVEHTWSDYGHTMHFSARPYNTSTDVGLLSPASSDG